MPLAALLRGCSGVVPWPSVEVVACCSAGELTRLACVCGGGSVTGFVEFDSKAEAEAAITKFDGHKVNADSNEAGLCTHHPVADPRLRGGSGSQSRGCCRRFSQR